MSSIPKLAASPVECAWPNVRWDHSVDIEARPLRITNEISGDGREADYLRHLVSNGYLVWTAEVRCPSTAFSHTVWSSDSELSVDLLELSDSLSSRDRFLFCGIAATKRFPLNTEGALPIYESVVDVEPGSWLCSQPLVYEIGHPIHSLLKWRVDNELDEGRLAVKPIAPLRYEASARRELFDEIVDYRRKDIWVAALISALADLHEQACKSEAEIEEDSEAQPSEALAYFRRHDIPCGDMFNSAEAATQLAPFEVTPELIPDEEDTAA